LTTFIDAAPEDVAYVEQALGRAAAGRFAVVVRRTTGEPVVIENEPHLRDGTPMPTLLWLLDPELHDAVSRIESNGGVHRFEPLVDEDSLRRTHDEYEARRKAATLNTSAPQPSGGVGGTRTGIKCLHAHVANFLAGHFDPVGELVAAELSLPPLVIETVR
jgi:hypothetical protein